MKDVVIKLKKPIKGKWYLNTISGKPVSESTAKRYNSYFRRNPEGTLSRAYGGYKFKPDVKVSQQKEWVRKLWYNQEQLILTKNKKGKQVEYSPFTDRVLTEKERNILKKLDYSVLNGQIEIHLHRLTKDGKAIYHILKYKPEKEIRSELDFDGYVNYIITEVIPAFRRELNKIKKYHKIDNTNQIYGQFDVCLYSDNDYIPTGKTFGGFLFNQEGIDRTLDEMLETFDHYLRKFLNYNYHYIVFNEISIYIRAWSTERNIKMARYRLGVTGFKNGNRK